jgi:hypothetical protein
MTAFRIAFLTAFFAVVPSTARASAAGVEAKAGLAPRVRGARSRTATAAVAEARSARGQSRERFTETGKGN